MEGNKNIDYNYILSNYDQNTYEIPHSFDSIKWKLGETYRIRISNIYDPSKFWIVHYENELSLFYKYMNSFYDKMKEKYRMPPEFVKVNRYCAAYTDNAFYRGIIVDIPLFNKDKIQVVVFLFDFGFTNVVTVDNLYFLCEKMYKLPRYAVRACLYGIEPTKTDTWTNESYEYFKELTQGKVLLCVLTEKDTIHKTVFIRVVDLVQVNKIIDIGDLLVKQKLAKLTALRKNKTKSNKNRIVPKVNYPYLFPSFDALENGKMPPTVLLTEFLKQGLTSYILFKPYISINGVGL